MRGRARGRKAEAELARTVSLIGAYFAGQLAQADWKHVPSLRDFLAGFEPREPLSNGEIAARFAAWALNSKPTLAQGDD